MSDDQLSGAWPAAAWIAIAWLIAIVALSATATLRLQPCLQWTHYLPGRDKTGHFLADGRVRRGLRARVRGRRSGAARLRARVIRSRRAVVVIGGVRCSAGCPTATFSGVDLASSLPVVASFGALAALCARAPVRAARRRR
jgi:hypothetical protein